MDERVTAEKFLELLENTYFGRVVDPPQHTGLVLWIEDPQTHVQVPVEGPSPYDMTVSEYGRFCRQVMRWIAIAREEGRKLDRADAASEESCPGDAERLHS